jgi:hypothetical protein
MREHIFYKVWDPRRLRTLRASVTCYRSSITFIHLLWFIEGVSEDADWIFLDHKWSSLLDVVMNYRVPEEAIIS